MVAVAVALALERGETGVAAPSATGLLTAPWPVRYTVMTEPTAAGAESLLSRAVGVLRDGVIGSVLINGGRLRRDSQAESSAGAAGAIDDHVYFSALHR